MTFATAGFADKNTALQYLREYTAEYKQKKTATRRFATFILSAVSRM